MVRRLRPLARLTALSLVVSRRWRSSSRISTVSILLPAINPPSATIRCSLLEGYTFFRRKTKAVVQHCRRSVDCAVLPTTPFILLRFIRNFREASSLQTRYTTPYHIMVSRRPLELYVPALPASVAWLGRFAHGNAGHHRNVHQHHRLGRHTQCAVPRLRSVVNPYPQRLCPSSTRPAWGGL